MRTVLIIFAAALPLALLTPAAARLMPSEGGDDTRPALVDLREIPSPAGPATGQPQLTTAPDGRTVFSWIEAADEGRHRLRYALRTADGWSDARTVVEGDNFFVNWADVPSVVPLADGRLAAHWLFRAGAGTYAYHVGIKVTDPGATTWSDTIVPHHDRTETEHGFVSLYDAPGGGLGLIWLDGRDFASRPAGQDGHQKGDMAVRATTILEGRTLGEETLVDARACECCPTAAVRTERGVLIAYRDRNPTETRDIYVARLEDGRWSEPAAVHADNWRIPGCPVNGPALSADRQRVAIAWFTAEGGEPRVLVAFSDDGGRSFGKPIRGDDAVTLGRVDVEQLPDGSALVSWVEFKEGGSEFRVRRIDRDGSRGPSQLVTSIGQERASGYPRLTRRGNEILVAWTATGKPSQVRTAVARIGPPAGSR